MTNYPTEPGFYLVKYRDEITIVQMVYADYYKPPKRDYYFLGSDETGKDKDFKPEDFIRKIEP